MEEGAPSAWREERDSHGRRARPDDRRRPILFSRIVRGFKTVQSWLQRVRERHALSAMDERSLKDIGLSRLDALREVNKPFWRP